jgi:hypothetical protein
MMIDENKNGLKGHYNLAQGKRSGALGWKTDMKIVREITFIKEKILFRTNGMTLIFPEMMFYNSLRGFHYMDLRFAPIRKLNSVRKELFALFIEFPLTVFTSREGKSPVYRACGESTDEDKKQSQYKF